MSFIEQMWYRLPDGTRVQAARLPRYWELAAADGTPIFIVTANRVYQFSHDTLTQVSRVVLSTLQISDFTAEESSV